MPSRKTSASKRQASHPRRHRGPPAHNIKLSLHPLLPGPGRTPVPHPWAAVPFERMPRVLTQARVRPQPSCRLLRPEGSKRTWPWPLKPGCNEGQNLLRMAPTIAQSGPVRKEVYLSLSEALQPDSVSEREINVDRKPDATSRTRILKLTQGSLNKDGLACQPEYAPSKAPLSKIVDIWQRCLLRILQTFSNDEWTSSLFRKPLSRLPQPAAVSYCLPGSTRRLECGSRSLSPHLLLQQVLTKDLSVVATRLGNPCWKYAKRRPEIPVSRARSSKSKADSDLTGTGRWASFRGAIPAPRHHGQGESGTGRRPFKGRIDDP